MTPSPQQERIWELDAFRGICILGMVLIHLGYDLKELFGLIPFDYPQFFFFLKDWGGILFLLLSGVCVTLGHHPVRRGLAVFAAGLLCFLVTWAMAALKLQSSDIIIWFGVLHCLGLCMILYPPVSRLPVWAVSVLSAALLLLGYWFLRIPVELPWLFPFGLTTHGFVSSDYFPLLPNTGWFLLGSVLGRTLYRKRTSLLPGRIRRRASMRFLSWCGRQSLWIYLIHQPVLFGLLTLFTL